MSGRRVFITASILWAALLAVAPFVATRSSPGHGWYAVALAVYGAGRFVCHQLPERSFRLWTAQLPVCARCTGIYVGGAMAAMAAATRGVRSRPDLADAGGPGTARRARLSRRWPGIGGAMDRLGVDSRVARMLVAAAALPTAATLLLEWTTGVRPSNLVRAVSGAPLGAAIVLVVAAALVAVPPLAPTPAGRKVN